MSLLISDEDFMRVALEAARVAGEQGEIPVGACLVQDNQIITTAFNNPIFSNDPTAHAEINVMRQAAEKLNNYRLANTTLYVTLEPCMMCAGALIQARVNRLVFGASEPKSGVIQSCESVFNKSILSETHVSESNLNSQRKVFNHYIECIGGVLKEECQKIIQDWFKKKRKQL
ncbi:MAG: tRNA adenosine(34) deaminase TadA [Pseudomonadota bacterium]